MQLLECATGRLGDGRYHTYHLHFGIAIPVVATEREFTLLTMYTHSRGLLNDVGILCFALLTYILEHAALLCGKESVFTGLVATVLKLRERALKVGL